MIVVRLTEWSYLEEGAESRRCFVCGGRAHFDLARPGVADRERVCVLCIAGVLLRCLDGVL